MAPDERISAASFFEEEYPFLDKPILTFTIDLSTLFKYNN
jgi:CDP-glycerol glycerophosphotransferase (TagB/SpsB family)